MKNNINAAQTPAHKQHVSPNVNISENKETLMLEVEMPGLLRDDITLETDNDTLVIRATNKTSTTAQEGYTLIHQERQAAYYERSFILSDMVDRNNIQATYTNGILTITLPKVPAAARKTIKISDS